MKIERILIANRGEIAVRIARACRRLGIESVLAASDADTHSTAARMADRVIRIGPAPATASYLDVDKVVAAARYAEADAIHPGYGFLSENQQLARACEAAGIVFIGPTIEQLAAVGDKLQARAHALTAGLPVVPGGEVGSVDDGLRIAEELGRPLLIKAVGGGGGRGMKRVNEGDSVESLMRTAMAEARSAFGDERVYLERYVESGRHVEVQLLGDGERVIHLGDRDCSVQRRYQKLIEEAPAPQLPAALQDEMRTAAVRFGEHLRYRGAGTVEFLVDTQRGSFHFLEMNARIQVEHPVTEQVTGIDLVAEQIAIAEGKPLALRQEDVVITGHAIECRINAEDDDAMPSPGTVTRAEFPAGPGIRVDTYLSAGTTVPPFYDSLVAKLIVSGADRGEALARMRDALDRCVVEGVAINAARQRAIVGEPAFAAGGVDTSWI